MRLIQQSEREGEIIMCENWQNGAKFLQYNLYD